MNKTDTFLVGLMIGVIAMMIVLAFCINSTTNKQVEQGYMIHHNIAYTIQLFDKLEVPEQK